MTTGNQLTPQPTDLRDRDGRLIRFRSLTALDTLRLFKAAGPTLAQNQPWLSVATLAYSVVEIDGVPVPTPTSETHIESIVDRLGESALSMIADHLDAEANDTPIKIAASAGN